MKDYVDEMMAGVQEIQQPIDNTFDVKDVFEAGVCPFCQREEFAMRSEKTPNGRNFHQLCISCGRCCLIEVDDFLGITAVSEVVLPDNIE
jgi:hypothetical protein